MTSTMFPQFEIPRVIDPAGLDVVRVTRSNERISRTDWSRVSTVLLLSQQPVPWLTVPQIRYKILSALLLLQTVASMFSMYVRSTEILLQRLFEKASMHSPLIFVLPLLQLFLSSVFVEAALQNVTVDDTNGDPLTGASINYTPASDWNVGNGCKTCAAAPDASSAKDATWHDATYDPNSTVSAEKDVQQVQFNFTGTAIYVYGIQCHLMADLLDCHADMEFLIDGEKMSQTYTFTPDNPGTNTYTYNVLLYGNDSLSSGPHSIVVQNGVQSDNTSSLILLDYMIYSTHTDNSTDPTDAGSSDSHAHSSDTHTIVLAVVIPLVVAGFLAALLFLYIRRRRQRIQNGHGSVPDMDTIPTPFIPTSVRSDEQVRHGVQTHLNATQSPLLSHKTPDTPRTPAASTRQEGWTEPSSNMPQYGSETDMPPPAYDTLPTSQ
ncbi:hypothetical protein NM688_g5928 [Phlebia brevispora]|uniref:Uncharacterized protein n=1 Tax=Phlebia brevispora TaxID=194682 RepID=A0ACC1SN14_9APHY|nr:hypothetical protein NM688_g5928 [Phlebia brevispora]